jgi:hypothetical protein
MEEPKQKILLSPFSCLLLKVVWLIVGMSCTGLRIPTRLTLVETVERYSRERPVTGPE